MRKLQSTTICYPSSDQFNQHRRIPRLHLRPHHPPCPPRQTRHRDRQPPWPRATRAHRPKLPSLQATRVPPPPHRRRQAPNNPLPNHQRLAAHQAHLQRPPSRRRRPFRPRLRPRPRGAHLPRPSRRNVYGPPEQAAQVVLRLWPDSGGGHADQVL